MTISHFHTKIRGIAQEQSRQDAAAGLVPGMLLTMSKPDPALPRFPHALELWSPMETMLGFVSDELAFELDGKINRGYRYVLIVKSITGGTRDKPNRGVNLLAVQAGPDDMTDEACDYINLLIATDPELGGILKHVSSQDPNQKKERVQKKKSANKSFNPFAKLSKSALENARNSWSKFDVECSGATQTTVESQAEQLDRMPDMGPVYPTQDRLIAAPGNRSVLAVVQDQTQTLPI